MLILRNHFKQMNVIMRMDLCLEDYDDIMGHLTRRFYRHGVQVEIRVRP